MRRTRGLTTCSTAAVPVIAAVLLGGLVGCSNREAPRFKEQHQAAGTTATASPAAGGGQQVTVQAADTMRFTPSAIVARPGRLTIVVRNVGKDPHNFEIPTLGADAGNIPAGMSATVTVTLSKPGSYPFDCAYHVALGMVGTVQVVAG